MVAEGAIPRQAADRFALTFEEFVAGVRGALARSPGHPGVPRWQQEALPLLSRDLAEVQTAMKSYEAGNPEPLRAAASSALSLARKMDGFPLDFAGKETGDKIAEQRRFVVMAAWQVLHSASET